jgi:hypothetical protein
MINTVDSWFRDSVTDAFVPKHKGKGPGGGQFTSGPGGGTASRKPSRRAAHARGSTQVGSHQTPPPSQQKQHGAAAAVAAAVSRLAQHAKHEIGETGSELFGSREEEQTLTKGLGETGTPARMKVMNLLSKNVPKFLIDSLKQDVHHWKNAGNTLYSVAAGLPMSSRDWQSVKFMGRKAVITAVKMATGIHLVPGVGHLAEHALGHAADYIVSQFAEHVVDHAIDEHGTKLASASLKGGARQAHGYFTERQRREATEMGGGDSAFYDAEPSDEEREQLILDFLKTVGDSVNTVPINMKNLIQQYKTLKLQEQQGKETDKASPMFGGLGGNNPLKIGDEGTAEGAKKGWLHRHRGTKPLSEAGASPQLQRTASHGLKKTKPELRKTPPRATFEEMRAKAAEFPEKKPRPPKRKAKAGTQAPRPVTREMKQELPHQRIPTQSQQFGMGERRSEKSKGSMLPGGRPRTQISMGQKEREGPAKEQREVIARKHRAEISELTRRQKSGGSLSDKEKQRLATLVRIHGPGESQPVGTKQTQGPAKYEKADTRPGGRPGLRRIRRNR